MHLAVNPHGSVEGVITPISHFFGGFGLAPFVARFSRGPARKVLGMVLIVPFRGEARPMEAIERVEREKTNIPTKSSRIPQ